MFDSKPITYGIIILKSVQLSTNGIRPLQIYSPQSRQNHMEPLEHLGFIYILQKIRKENDINA